MQQGSFFTMSVDDVFRLGGPGDCVVAGDVTGTVRVGDAVTVWDPGNDVGEIFQTQVVGIETGPHQTAREATDQTAALVLRGAAAHVIRTASVVTSLGVPEEKVREVYPIAVLQNYVLPKHKGETESPELTDAVLEKMSIADLAEAFWLHGWYWTQHASSPEEALATMNSAWAQRCADVLAKKILDANEIYAVFNKSTGCPHMFTEISQLPDGRYESTRPAIWLFPASAKNHALSSLNPDVFELRCIRRGRTGTGISNFLSSAFYQDGACAVQVVTSKTILGAEQLVAPPETGSEGDSQRVTPVANPQLVRWLLLMGQMGRPETEDERIAYGLYWNLFCQELPKARLLQPAKVERSEGADGAASAEGAEASGMLETGTTLSFPTMQGKNGRDAAYLYTDWKRFRSKWGAGWEGLVRTAEDVLQLLDCAINVTDNPAEGCYVSDEAYRRYCALEQ